MSLYSHSSLRLDPFALHISKFATDSSGSMHPSQASPMATQHNNCVEVGATPVAGVTDSSPILPEKTQERSVAVVDDDIQILFSVPRRRKKKRKRLDSSRASVATQASRNPDNEQLSRNVVPLPEFKQYGTTYPHVQLHYTEGGRNAPASASFVAFEPSINSQNNGSQSMAYGSPFLGTQGSQFHALSSPTSWWEPSHARSHSNPLRNSDWRSIHDEDIVCRKRRHQANWEMPKPQRFQYRQSMQISPRSNPIPSFTPLTSSAYGMSINSHDMYGRLNHTLLPPSSWPSFDWNAFNDANTNQFISQSLQQAGMGTESHQEGGTNSSDLPQHEYQSKMSQAHAIPTKPWVEGECQPTTEIETSQSPIRCTPAIEPPQTCNIQSYATAHAHSDSTQQPLVHIVSHEEQRLNSDSNNSWKTTPPEPLACQRVVDCPNSLQGDTHTTQPSDIARKPSLYRIPPWPAPLLASLSSTISADGKQKPNSSKIPGTLSSKARAKTAEIQPVPQAKTQAHSPSMSTPAKSLNVSSPQNDNLIPSSDADFQLPKAHAGRKNSPNLIVDIAETCQELFPFAAVAERHKVPLKKVFDTFSAIIQLPLLRNADDRRRHGSLGKRRMKEYRDAKKAMERAREAERKAQMKVMRARVEEASKRGKHGQTQEKGNELLKAAVLNNARDQSDGVGAGSST